MDKLVLKRIAYLPDGTFGILTLPSGKKLYTCELPWKNNTQRASCIPNNTYVLKKRASDVVRRSTKNAYSEGWEITNVPGRTFIMIHPANWPHELLGCISVGTTLGIISGKYGVGNSRAAFDILMNELTEPEYALIIENPYNEVLL